MSALPLASPGTGIRGSLGVAALGDWKRPVTELGGETERSSNGRTIRMRRSPGGRQGRLNVRLTEEEECQIRLRADRCGLSAQRFLIEAAMSGTAAEAAERRRAQRNAERARLVLASISNNVNQLAKWANTNNALPDTFADTLDDIRRATIAVAETTERLHSTFERDR
jgi:uncharacterized protein (DUF1778 family)